MTSVPPPGMEQRWPIAPAPAATGSPPRRSPSSPPRRLLQAVGVLAALLVLVLLNAALHDGSEDLNPIAAAAERTREVTGARLSVEVLYSGGGLERPVAAAGGGAFDARTGRSRIRLSAKVSPLESMHVEAVGDGRTVYLRSSEFGEALPRGKRWVALQAWLGRGDPSSVGSGGAVGDQLEMLRAIGAEPRELGRTRVRGVAVTHYRSAIRPAAVARHLRAEGEREAARQYEQVAKQAQGPVRVEVWVDGDGIARRLRSVLTIAPDGVPPLTTDTRIEFFDLGSSHRIRLPRPAKVFDATPVVRAEQHLVDGRMFFPRGVEPGERLSADTFRKRANAACSRFEARGEALEAKYAGALRELEEATAAASSPEELVRALQDWAEAVMPSAIRLTRSGYRELYGIAPPVGLQVRYREVLRLGTRGAEMQVASIRAYELGALKLGKELDRWSDRLERQADRTALRLGLDRCAEDDDSQGGGGGAPGASPNATLA